jgi:hypothetical protein
MLRRAVQKEYEAEAAKRVAAKLTSDYETTIHDQSWGSYCNAVVNGRGWGWISDNFRGFKPGLMHHKECASLPKCGHIEVYGDGRVKAVNAK